MIKPAFVLSICLSLSSICLAKPSNNPPEVAIQSITKLFPGMNATFAALNAGDMLVLDLDNTVFREAQMLGTDEWYSHAVAQLTADGITSRQASEILEPVNRAIKEKSEMRLMEDEMPGLIAELQARGVAVVAVTARHPDLSEITLRQLADLGIDLRQSQFPAQNLKGFRLPELSNAFLFSGGVAFTDGSPKGMVLSALLEKTGFAPQHVIAIDDRIHHVHTFTEALLTLQIPGRVIHYLRALEEPFEPELADLQFAHFKATGVILSNAQAKKNLKGCQLNLQPPSFQITKNAQTSRKARNS